MTNEPNIAELAVAAWRLERWLDNLVAERKMAAKSSLRSIKKFLEASNIEIVDPVGTKFDPGLAIEVINNEAADIDESELIIIETSAPIIKQNGAVIQYGRVILGTSVKEQKANSEILTEDNDNAEQAAPLTNNEKIAEQSNDLFINAYYLVQRIEVYSELEGCRAGIHVRMGKSALDDSLGIYLMDKYTFRDFQNGYNPTTAYSYIPQSESSYFTLPYQGDWYIVTMNKAKIWKSEYEVEFHMVWIPEKGKKEDKKNAKTNGIDGSKDDLQNSHRDKPSYEFEEKTAVSENGNIKLEDFADESILKGEKRYKSERQEIIISEKAAQSLSKKNKASYVKEQARMLGLLGKPHGKKDR